MTRFATDQPDPDRFDGAEGAAGCIGGIVGCLLGACGLGVFGAMSNGFLVGVLFTGLGGLGGAGLGALLGLLGCAAWRERRGR